MNQNPMRPKPVSSSSYASSSSSIFPCRPTMNQTTTATPLHNNHMTNRADSIAGNALDPCMYQSLRSIAKKGNGCHKIEKQHKTLSRGKTCVVLRHLQTQPNHVESSHYYDEGSQPLKSEALLTSSSFNQPHSMDGANGGSRDELTSDSQPHHALPPSYIKAGMAMLLGLMCGLNSDLHQVAKNILLQHHPMCQMPTQEPTTSSMNNNSIPPPNEQQQPTKKGRTAISIKDLLND